MDYLLDYKVVKILKKNGRFGRVFLVSKNNELYVAKEFLFSKDGATPYLKELSIKNFSFVPTLVDHFHNENRGYVLRKFIKSFDFQGFNNKKIFLNTKKRICFLLPFLLKLCDYYDELHKNSIIHNDVRASNILIEKNSEKIFLIDFSLAKMPNLKNEKLFFSLIFSPPEQIFKIRELINETTDLYMFGIMIWSLLNRGGVPFKNSNPEFLINMQLNLPLKNTGIERDFFKIIEKLTFKTALPLPPRMMNFQEIYNHIKADQQKRYKSFRDLKKDLQNYNVYKCKH